MQRNEQGYKPYDLVWVTVPTRNAEGGKREYIGEVLSYPFTAKDGEQRVMVRRAPGHPGTLEEQPVTRLNRVAGAMRYVHYARCHGAGQFPEDMLRYDHAAPVNFTMRECDAPRYGWEPVIDPSFGEGGLLVARVTKYANPNWTVARWNSFCWRVEHLRSERIQEGS